MACLDIGDPPSCLLAELAEFDGCSSLAGLRGCDSVLVHRFCLRLTQALVKPAIENVRVPEDAVANRGWRRHEFLIDPVFYGARRHA